MKKITFTLAGLVVAFGIGALGCSPLATDAGSKKASWSLFKKKEYQQPQSMAVIWTEDTLVAPGKPTTRGIGGRIYFYNKLSQAIPVDGELTVYGFDETVRAATASVNPEADKRFRFTAEQFTTHFSESDLGASYSVWLPWDVVGGPQKEITLIPAFTTKTGQLVRGDASKVLLSGKREAPTAPTEPPNMLIGHQATQASANMSPSGFNQVRTAEAVVPTNSLGALPQLHGTPVERSRSTTTIAVPSASLSRP